MFGNPYTAAEWNARLGTRQGAELVEALAPFYEHPPRLALPTRLLHQEVTEALEELGLEAGSVFALSLGTVNGLMRSLDAALPDPLGERMEHELAGRLRRELGRELREEVRAALDLFLLPEWKRTGESGRQRIEAAVEWVLAGTGWNRLPVLFGGRAWSAPLRERVTATFECLLTYRIAFPASGMSAALAGSARVTPLLHLFHQGWFPVGLQEADAAPGPFLVLVA